MSAFRCVDRFKIALLWSTTLRQSSHFRRHQHCRRRCASRRAEEGLWSAMREWKARTRGDRFDPARWLPKYGAAASPLSSLLSGRYVATPNVIAANQNPSHQFGWRRFAVKDVISATPTFSLLRCCSASIGRQPDTLLKARNGWSRSPGSGHGVAGQFLASFRVAFCC
jgi:hypothetical protein